MTVQIDPASVSLTVDPGVSKARAAVSIVAVGARRIAFNHLTEGVNVAKAAAGGSPIDEPVIKMVGKFDAILGPGDKLLDWKFGFIQIGTVFALEDTYVGRTINEGHVKMIHRLKVSPAILLDSVGGLDPLSSRDPNINVESKGDKDIAHITCNLGALPGKKGDSPMGSSGAIVGNRKTNADDFLFEHRTDLGFTSVLVAIDPQNKVQPLAHVNWHLIWHFQFRWAGADNPTATPIPINSRADVLQVTKGPPTDQAIAALVMKPGGAFFNETVRAAKRDTVLANPPNREDNFSRPPGVPGDFFT